MADDLHELERVLRESGGRFGHREHLHLAWRLARAGDAPTAERALRASIQHVARRHGAADRYHETLTMTWLRLVRLHLVDGHDVDGHDEDFAEFLVAHEGLLERELPSRHFSATLLWSEEARRQLVEPDLRPLPAVP